MCGYRGISRPLYCLSGECGGSCERKSTLYVPVCNEYVVVSDAEQVCGYRLIPECVLVAYRYFSAATEIFFLLMYNEGAEEDMAMSTTLGRRSNMYKKNVYRSEISQAWCPAHSECCVSVGKPAQLRRAILLKSQLLRMKLSEKRLQLSELLIAIGERLSTRTSASLDRKSVV